MKFGTFITKQRGDAIAADVRHAEQLGFESAWIAEHLIMPVKQVSVYPYSPDGKYILFTSDRGGSPQIYRMSVSINYIERMTFEGFYNKRRTDRENFDRKREREAAAFEQKQAAEMEAFKQRLEALAQSLKPAGKLVRPTGISSMFT